MCGSQGDTGSTGRIDDRRTGGEFGGEPFVGCGAPGVRFSLAHGNRWHSAPIYSAFGGSWPVAAAVVAAMNALTHSARANQRPPIRSARRRRT